MKYKEFWTRTIKKSPCHIKIGSQKLRTKRLKEARIKVLNILIPYDLESIDIENANIDGFVKTDDGYSYTLSLATSKNLQFLMDKEKMDYDGPVYQSIFMKKLIPEVTEQIVKAFAEEDGVLGKSLSFWRMAGVYR